MLADLDLLLTAVFAAADDLLPEHRQNARRSVTDAEVVTLAVAQAIMDVSSAAVGAGLLEAPIALQRAHRLADRHLRAGLSGLHRPDGLARFDPGRVPPLSRYRPALGAGPACAHHYSRGHSRWFWGMRLHLLAAPDGTPRATILASADEKERAVALRLFARSLHAGRLAQPLLGRPTRAFADLAV